VIKQEIGIPELVSQRFLMRVQEARQEMPHFVINHANLVIGAMVQHVKRLKSLDKKTCTLRKDLDPQLVFKFLSTI
jgi:hypothetical protein